ncbi:MAG: hypothetical protein JST19_21445 [Bacteroidetes bacterium]|nr:hypothetical protein [Bacteroidota bacterium]
MKRDELKARFSELLAQYPPIEEIERLFEKALQSGALNLESDPMTDYRLAKIIYHAILLNMAEQCRPYSPENRKEAENLLLFL